MKRRAIEKVRAKSRARASPSGRRLRRRRSPRPRSDARSRPAACPCADGSSSASPSPSTETEVRSPPPPPPPPRSASAASRSFGKGSSSQAQSSRARTPRAVADGEADAAEDALEQEAARDQRQASARRRGRARRSSARGPERRTATARRARPPSGARPARRRTARHCDRGNPGDPAEGGGGDRDSHQTSPGAAGRPAAPWRPMNRQRNGRRERRLVLSQSTLHDPSPAPRSGPAMRAPRAEFTRLGPLNDPAGLAERGAPDFGRRRNPDASAPRGRTHSRPRGGHTRIWSRRGLPHPPSSPRSRAATNGPAEAMPRLIGPQTR